MRGGSSPRPSAPRRHDPRRADFGPMPCGSKPRGKPRRFPTRPRFADDAVKNEKSEKGGVTTVCLSGILRCLSGEWITCVVCPSERYAPS